MSCINYSTAHNVAVAIGTRLRAGRPRNRISISGTGKRILLSKASRSVLGQCPIQCARRVLSLEIKRPGREADEYVTCRDYRPQNLLLCWNERTRHAEIQPEVLAPWRPQKGPLYTFWLGNRAVCVLWRGGTLLPSASRIRPVVSHYTHWAVMASLKVSYREMTEAMNLCRYAVRNLSEIGYAVTSGGRMCLQ